jgi:hypothetical protein
VGDMSNATGFENFPLNVFPPNWIVPSGAALAGIVPKRVTMRTMIVIKGKMDLVFIMYSPLRMDNAYSIVFLLGQKLQTVFPSTSFLTW